MNGKPNSGQINSTSKVPSVSGPKSDTGCLPTRATGTAIPGVSGDSKGNINAPCSVPPVSGGRTGSPNNGANPQHPAGGEMRTPITG